MKEDLRNSDSGRAEGLYARFREEEEAGFGQGSIEKGEFCSYACSADEGAGGERKSGQLTTRPV